MKCLKWRSQLFALSLALFLAPASWAGEIKGQVSAGSFSVKSVVIYLDVIPGKTFDAPAKPVVMDQRHLEFVPHVLMVVKGTTVDFLNSDSTLHNVFWTDIGGNKKLAHNLGTWPQGQKKSFTFNDPGLATLLCNVHPEMSGYVLVVTNPYFAAVGQGGDYAIKNVPPGHYALKAWSEEGKPLTQPVEVTGDATTVNLTLHR
jgi:plastocyanin